MPITCSVVSYKNPPEELAEALRSIAATPGIAVTLIDNSPEDALSAVARRIGVRYLHRPDNPGFGAAHNIALREALETGATYHMVVNPDVRFGPEVIPALRAYMDAHQEAGLVMPDIRYPDGRRQHLCKLLPHPGDLLVRRFLPSLYRWSGRLETYEMRQGSYDGIMEVPALSGCFMFLRCAVLRETGGFDERYFMYLEDVDLSRRIGEVARTVFYPAVAITHAYQKGSYRSSVLLWRHIRSAIMYFNKWGWFHDPGRAAANRAALRSLERAGQAEIVQ